MGFPKSSDSHNRNHVVVLTSPNDNTNLVSRILAIVIREEHGGDYESCMT